mmetsp:Transcript_120724/g.342030  ORF Transcript_120724/g.342030 Transcript_120724/m.342030 type:complete len:409 (+) Transcript_120724:141-1367(+)
MQASAWLERVQAFYLKFKRAKTRAAVRKSSEKGTQRDPARRYAKRKTCAAFYWDKAARYPRAPHASEAHRALGVLLVHASFPGNSGRCVAEPDDCGRVPPLACRQQVPEDLQPGPPAEVTEAQRPALEAVAVPRAGEGVGCQPGGARVAHRPLGGGRVAGLPAPGLQQPQVLQHRVGDEAHRLVGRVGLVPGLPRPREEGGGALPGDLRRHPHRQEGPPHARPAMQQVRGVAHLPLGGEGAVPQPVGGERDGVEAGHHRAHEVAGGQPLYPGQAPLRVEAGPVPHRPEVQLLRLLGRREHEEVDLVDGVVEGEVPAVQAVREGLGQRPHGPAERARAHERGVHEQAGHPAPLTRPQEDAQQPVHLPLEAQRASQGCQPALRDLVAPLRPALYLLEEAAPHAVTDHADH